MIICVGVSPVFRIALLVAMKTMFLNNKFIVEENIFVHFVGPIEPIWNCPRVQGRSNYNPQSTFRDLWKCTTDDITTRSAESVYLWVLLNFLLFLYVFINIHEYTN